MASMQASQRLSVIYVEYDVHQEMLAALKGARDAIDAIPEGIRGVHDSLLNRQLRRIDEAIAKATNRQ